MSEWGTNQVIAHFKEKLKLEGVSQSCDNGKYETLKGNSLYFPPNLQHVLGGLSELSNKISVSAESKTVNYKTFQPNADDPLGILEYLRYDEVGISSIREMEKNLANIRGCYKDGLIVIDEKEAERLHEWRNKWKKFWSFDCHYHTAEYKKEKEVFSGEMRESFDVVQGGLKGIVERPFSHELNAGEVDAGISFKPSTFPSRRDEEENIGTFNIKFNGTLTQESETESIIDHPLTKGISDNSDTVRIALDGLVIKGENKCKQTPYSICVRKGHKIDSSVIEDAEKIIFNFS